MKSVFSAFVLLLAMTAFCNAAILNVPNDYLTIQAAIDAAQNGDTIDVDAGTYVEQLTVDNKTLTITGAGQGSTVIQCPAVLNITFVTSANNKCIVGVINGGQLTLSDVTIDGLGLGNANVRFTGMGVHNAGAAVTDCEILDIRETPFSGAQHGIGFYSVNDNGTDYNIDLTGVSISGYQKNAITCVGANGIITATDCVTTGAGQTGTIAQNGIQISSGATGTIDGCTVEGNVWTGGYWTSTGILLYSAGWVDVVNCPSISENQMGTYFITTDGTFEGNTMTASPLSHGEDGYYWGLGIDREGIQCPKVSAFDGGRIKRGSRSPTEVDVANCTFVSDQSGHGTGIGVWAASEDNVDAEIVTCEISGWETGIEVWDDGTALPTVRVFACDIHDNVLYGIYNFTTSAVIAQYNWWGHATGPYNPQWNPDGQGDTISDLVWFWPYLESPDYITVPWDYPTIQAAIDAAVNGDTIVVAPGDYEEQLFVDNKDVNIIGAGKGVTNIVSPAILDVTFTTSADNKCIVGVINDGSLDLSGVTVDGQGLGNANYRFTGIGFHNTGGSVNNCEVKDIRNTPFSGTQHGIGIYALIMDGTDRTLDLVDCEITGYQKNGLTFNGINCIINVENCTTVGEGQTTVTAQNGIQFGYDSKGTIDGCTVIGNCYTGANWTASGILLYDADEVDVINCPGIIDNQTAVNFILTNGSFNNNTLTAGVNAQGIDGNYWGLSLDTQVRSDKSPGNPIRPSAFTERIPATDSKVTFFVDVLDNIFTADKSGEGLAVSVWTASSNRIVADMQRCQINDWALGIQVDKGGMGTPVVTVHDCDIYDNDTYGGIVNGTPDIVVAKWNWWGHPSGPYHPTLNPLGQGNEVSDNVEFKPFQWLLPTTFDFFKTLRVPEGYATIQAAIDAAQNGDTIKVAPGDYEEQLFVDGKTVTIIGSGTDKTTILCPELLDVSFVTSADNKCIVGILNGADLTMQNLTVDGRGYGNSNYRFSGIGFRNAGGAIRHCHIKDIQDTPFSGSQHGVGVYAYNNDGNDYEIVLRNCMVPGYQKTGIALSGANVIATVTGCTTEGIGGTSVTAQNGIQLGYGAKGTVDGCTVIGNCYTGSSWVASGILLWQATDVVVKNCPLIKDNQMGVYFVVTSGTYDNNTLEAGEDAQGENEAFYGLAVDDLSAHAPLASPYQETGAPRNRLRAGTTVDVLNSSFLSDQSGASTGIGAWAADGDNVVVTVADSQIRDWVWGIDVWDDGTALPTVDISQSSITGNTEFGVMNSTTELVTAEYNWWGDVTGPYHPTLNPGGLGDAIDGYVWFANWLIEDPLD